MHEYLEDVKTGCVLGGKVLTVRDDDSLMAGDISITIVVDNGGFKRICDAQSKQHQDDH